MSDSPASLQAIIASLELALARHELIVEFADRKVTYRSISDIVAAIDYFKQKLALALNAASARPRQYYPFTGKGLDC